MKVNVEATFNDLDGETIMDGDKPVTLGAVASQALTAVFRGEEDLSGDKKCERFLLAVKMRKSADGLPVDLTPEEAALAKQCIGKAYPPIIVGQAFPLLNGG